MKKILILYTGGTIGMDYVDDSLNVVPGLFKSQLATLAPIANVHIDLIEYTELIDSSDIRLDHWVQMINDIAGQYDSYDGFVIVHGTDTMAYTASMLAFALRGLNKPVVLTGAQLPLVHRRSDGWSNLVEALYSAAQSDLNEVVIVFNHKLFRGCRAQKVSTNSFLGFDSVDEAPLAEFGIEILWHKHLWLKTKRFNFSPIMPQSVKVLDISLCPGYTTELVAQIFNTTDVDAIVLQTYGTGTIPMKNQALVSSIKSATERGIIVVAVTQVIEGRVSSSYTNSKFSNMGVISGCDMTPEAAVAKLTVLLSTHMSKESIRSAVSSSLIGELTEIK